MNTKVLVAVVAVALVAIAAVALVLLNGNGSDNSDDHGGDAVQTVTDAVGREIEIPDNLNGGIVTVGGTGPLRFASMFDVYDKIIEVDKGDVTDNKNGRAYSYAYAYDKLNVDTQTHPDNKLESATVDSIGNKSPSLVITTESLWNNYNENFKTLAKKCTVLVLKNQQMQYMTDSNGKLSDYMTFNINILGEVFKKEDRAKELISGMESVISDISKLSGVSDKKVYVAGVTISGSNTLNTTFPIYLPFSLNGVKNAYNGGSTENKVVINVEEFATMDIDMMIIDPSSSDKIKGNQDSQNVLKYIYGVNNDSDPSNDIPMYVTVPIVWDSINYDCALASSYYVESLVYGTLTVQEVENKIDSIFKLFYGSAGKNVFADMKSFFVGKSSSNGQEMPVLQRVSVVKEGDEYRFVKYTEPVPQETVDFAGKPIERAESLDNGIVAVGQDSFRWMTYFGLADRCVMVDMNDMTNYLGKSFMYVGRALVDIEGGDSAKLTAEDPARAYFTHTNCGITDEDVGTIISLNPSMVVIPEGFYSDYPTQTAAIEKAGIKTLAIGYIYTFLTEGDFEVTDDLRKQIAIISEALGQEQRGQELLDAFSYLADDFASLRGKSTQARTGYVGALAYNGAHGLDSSIPYYMPMALAGVENILSGKAVYEGSGVKTYSAADIAKSMKPDTILFVDASGYFQNTTNDSMGVAKLFQGHEAYIVADYIWTGVNYDTIFVDAYQILRYAYGDSVLTEQEFGERIDKVYDLFYGQHVSNRNISEFSKTTVPLPSDGTTIFEDMSDFHVAFRGNPVYGTVSIDSEGKLAYA